MVNNSLLNLSAIRNDNAVMVRVQFVVPADGMMELLAINKLLTGRFSVTHPKIFQQSSTSLPTRQPDDFLTLKCPRVARRYF